MWEKEPTLAIELVKKAKGDFFIGNPFKRAHPHGRVEVKIPLMYNGFVLDLIHFDPIAWSVLPKGIPGVMGGSELLIDLQKIKEEVENSLKDLMVLEGVEFREPEDAWVVPCAFKKLIIAHIRVSADGRAFVPDYHATSEMRMNV